jgi:alkanesulfonate monooxygenase SsuD/methylene tetrahydromethanopterin reductase-like flavin-dependent oxidoreductase (luciferase family)
MAGSLLFPTTPPLLSLFSPPSRPSHARREHWRQCPVCKTVCAVELVVPIYVNRHTARHCGGKGEMRMGGEDCRRRQHQDDPNPPWGCGGDGPKVATTAGRNARAPPPSSMAATMAAAVAAGRRACCCCCWRRRQSEDDATVTTATMATMTATMACTVMAASTAMVATVMARAPYRNRRRRLCQCNYLCLHALSFCVSCFFDCSH